MEKRIEIERKNIFRVRPEMLKLSENNKEPTYRIPPDVIRTLAIATNLKYGVYLYIDDYGEVNLDVIKRTEIDDSIVDIPQEQNNEN